MNTGRKVKRYKSRESYRRFLAYIHTHTPSGKRARSKSQTIAARTPVRKKEKVVYVGGKRHKPKVQRGK